MELKFVGWINYYLMYKDTDRNIVDINVILKDNNYTPENKKHVWFLIEKEIKNQIIKNKYDFSGEHHQYGKCGCPVFELDGKLGYALYSYRAWGGLMADCWNEIEETIKYDYMDFYMWPRSEDSVTAQTELEYYNSNNKEEKS